MSETAKNTYAEMLAGIKSRVQTARIRAGLAANCELILLYWDKPVLKAWIGLS